MLYHFKLMFVSIDLGRFVILNWSHNFSAKILCTIGYTYVLVSTYFSSFLSYLLASPFLLALLLLCQSLSLSLSYSFYLTHILSHTSSLHLRNKLYSSFVHTTSRPSSCSKHQTNVVSKNVKTKMQKVKRFENGWNGSDQKSKVTFLVGAVLFILKR